MKLASFLFAGYKQVVLFSFRKGKYFAKDLTF